MLAQFWRHNSCQMIIHCINNMYSNSLMATHSRAVNLMKWRANELYCCAISTAWWDPGTPSHMMCQQHPTPRIALSRSDLYLALHYMYTFIFLISYLCKLLKAVKEKKEKCFSQIEWKTLRLWNEKILIHNLNSLHTCPLNSCVCSVSNSCYAVQYSLALQLLL